MANIIFSDVDGCIFDNNSHLLGIQRLNVEKKELEDAIISANHAGILFGLNSNRSIPDLIEVCEIIGQDIKVIGENGAFFGDYDHKNSKIRIMREASKKIILPKGLIPSTHQEIKSCTFLDGTYFETGRDYTAHIHCYKNMKPDLNKAKQVMGVVSDLNPDHKVFFCSDSSFWALPKDADKGTWIKHLKEHESYEVGMIGHDESDIPALYESDIKMAPSNHSLSAKLDYVSNKEFAKGTVDCLFWSINHWGA